MHGRGDNWDWSMEEGAAESVRELIRQWEVLHELPGAQILKSNPLRMVIALPANASRPSYIVKRYHMRNFREHLRSFLTPSKAETEWQALQFLRKVGIPSAAPIAMGEQRRGGVLLKAGLIMERVLDVLQLPIWLQRHEDDTALADAVITDVGALIGRLHAHGVTHGDLHAGNVLVQEVAGRPPKVLIIDLHTCFIGVEPPRLQRVANLAKFYHSLMGAPGFHGRRVIEGYNDAAGMRWTDDDVSRMHARVERASLRLERIRLGSRSKRCWKRTSEFDRDSWRGWKVNRRREVDRESLAKFVEGPRELHPVFKERAGQRIGVTTLIVDGKPTKVVAKIRSHRNILKRLYFSLGFRGPLERAWWAARALEVRGIATPRGLALVRRSELGLRRESILITEFIEGTTTLREDLLDRYFPPSSAHDDELNRRLGIVASHVRRLHDAGIYHCDLNPLNFLVGAQGSEHRNGNLWVIDLDSVRPHQRLTERRRLKNLMQIALIPEGHITAEHRRHILATYDGGEGRFTDGRWERDLESEMAREIIRIIARISRKEREHPLDPEVTDPRFRDAAKDLTREP